MKNAHRQADRQEAMAKLQGYLYGRDPADSTSRIKMLAAELAKVGWGDVALSVVLDPERSGPDCCQIAKGWYERVRRAVRDHDAEFFEEVAAAMRHLRSRGQWRKSSAQFPYESLKYVMARLALGLLSYLPALPPPDKFRAEIIQETKEAYAEECVYKNVGGEEYEKLISSIKGHEELGRQKEKIIRQMSDRKNGEIKWAQMIRELGLDSLIDVSLGRPSL